MPASRVQPVSWPDRTIAAGLGLLATQVMQHLAAQAWRQLGGPTLEAGLARARCVLAQWEINLQRFDPAAPRRHPLRTRATTQARRDAVRLVAAHVKAWNHAHAAARLHCMRHAGRSPARDAQPDDPAPVLRALDTPLDYNEYLQTPPAVLAGRASVLQRLARDRADIERLRVRTAARIARRQAKVEEHLRRQERRIHRTLTRHGLKVKEGPKLVIVRATEEPQATLTAEPPKAAEKPEPQPATTAPKSAAGQAKAAGAEQAHQGKVDYPLRE